MFIQMHIYIELFTCLTDSHLIKLGLGAQFSLVLFSCFKGEEQDETYFSYCVPLQSSLTSHEQYRWFADKQTEDRQTLGGDAGLHVWYLAEDGVMRLVQVTLRRPAW